MSRLLALLVFVCVTLSAGNLAAQQPPSLGELFTRAYELSVKGELDTALPLHEELVLRLPRDPMVLYNAGTAHLRAGNLGRAVLYLERALLADPGCSDCTANLSRAHELQQDRVIGTQREGEGAGTQSLTDSLPETGLALAFLAAHVLLVLVFFARRLARAERSRFALTLLLLVALLLDAVLGGLLALKVYSDEALPRAVVMDTELTVRKGPNPNFPQAFTVHEGLVVRLGNPVEDWREIWLDNGLHGYVPARSLAPIGPGE